MMLSSVLLVVLQLCSLQLIVVSRPTCRLQGDLVKSAHDLLKDLGGAFPARCLPYNANILFPRSALSFNVANHMQCDQVLSVVNESLWEAGKIFEDPEGPFPATWDEQKVARFQGLQDRIVEGASCLSGSSDVLTPYFSNVTEILKQQESAACGWKALRRDLVRFLKFTLQTHHTCFIWRSAKRL
ncbi:interferon phi 2 [Labrus bergylta]|uniref:interferon phi 2 n=1 Tax=Labrus bergylta TaxID=56723 RepID=UPI003314093E